MLDGDCCWAPKTSRSSTEAEMFGDDIGSVGERLREFILDLMDLPQH
jgi:hypothetical protein